MPILLNVINKGGGMAVIGYLIYIVCGLWGLFISFQIVASVFGEGIAFLSLVVAPALLAVAPLYALFSYGDWFPLAVVYGGTIVGGIFVTIGD